MGKLSRRLSRQRSSFQELAKQKRKLQERKKRVYAELMAIASKPDTLIEEKVDENGHKYLHIVEGGKKVESS